MLRRRPIRTALTVVALAVALPACGLPPLAGSSRTWPRPVRVYNPTGWQRAVATAVGAWNHTGAHVRFVVVSRASDADVIIVASDRALGRACRPDRNCIAYVSRVGYRRGARRPTRIYLPDAPAQEVRDNATATTSVAHELGHVLGLAHRHGCSIMNPVALAHSCPAKTLYPSAETYLCGPMLADVGDAVALYGGHRARAYRPVCASESL
jgi:hypothetical protein